MPSYREGTTGDISSICALGEEVNAIHHAAWPRIFAPPGPLERDREHWARCIGNGNTTFVAEEGGCIVGFVTVSVADESHSLLQPLRYARVGTVGVGVNHRGQGIGAKLMALAEQWALQQGAAEVRLNVWAFNEPALAMYNELGYQVRSHLLGKRLVGNGA